MSGQSFSTTMEARYYVSNSQFCPNSWASCTYKTGKDASEGKSNAVKAAEDLEGNYLLNLTTDGKYRNAKGTNPFYLKMPSSISNSNWKIDLSGIEFDWITLYCTEQSTSVTWTGSPLTVTVTVAEYNAAKKYIILRFDTGQIVTQKGYGYYKFTWEDAGVKIQKKHYVNGKWEDWKKSGILFRIYEDFSADGTDCENLLKSKYTDASGIVTFDKLETGETYCVKELFNNSDIKQKYKDSATTSSINYARDSAQNGTFSKVLSVTASNGTYATYEYGNIRKKYSFYIHKQDVETGAALSGVHFQVRPANDFTVAGETYTTSQVLAEGDTDENGNIQVCGLPDKQNYTVTETNEKQGYWNDLPQIFTVSSSSLTEYAVNGSCPTGQQQTKTDHKKYYCTAVKKVDATNTSTTLAGANFSVTNGSVQYNSSGVAGGDTLDDGLAYFFLGDNPNGQVVTENKAPVGWAPAEGNKSVAAYLLPYGTISNGTLGNTSFVDNCKSVVTNHEVLYKDNTLVINWYKDTENGKKASGAQFKVKGSSGYIHVSGMVNTTDASGITKNCYQYAANGSDTMVSDANGEVCVKGIPQGTYTVEETMPAEYHTFSNSTSINVNTGVNFAPYNSSNTFINLPTYFEFSKSVNDGDNEDIKIVVNGVEKSLHDLTTEELSRIDFNVYSGNDLLSFVETTENGKMIYSFGGNTIDLPTGNVVTDLHLDSERLIRISHLPKGTYTIKEKNNKVCDNNSNNNDCIGYYYPDYKQSSDYTFTITACSNDAANASACSSAGLSKGKATQKLTNKRTEIMFTKKDFYKYYDQKDIVDFENDKERSDFDRIKFKIKDASGRYLTVKKVKDVGTQTGDNSYSEYRYVSKDDNSDDGGTVMYARGGNIKITNLCRGNTYTIEEIEVPEDSVFVKENTSSTPTSVSYNIPCNELATGTDTKGSTTNIIEDKPTRIRLEKRDSKYNYLIPDETTTFKLYRCKKGEECHPGDYSSDEEREKAGMKLIKFYDRARISNDEEDPTDAEGLAGVEVYKMMSDSDIASGTKTVVDLHPYKGILVLRYLQANYNYALLETVAPKNYQLPVGRNAETTFKPVNDTVDVDSVDVPNKPTSLLIKKYDSKGNLLPGAEFKIYDAGTSCDPNISAADQKKTELKLKTIRDGIYENRENKDTDTVKTCRDREDEKCSDINPNAITKLTYETNLGNWSDFADESTKTEDGKKIEIQEGTALIQYLEYGHCYVIEETKAPDGHSLPTKDKDRFTMVTIKENDEYAHSTYYKFINKPTPFQFYKYDEFNKLLDGAEFKLQKLDDNKKYHDVTVSLDDDLKNLETIDEKDAEKLNKKITELKTQAESGVPFYKVDTTTDNTTITTKNGTAVVYYLSPGQYRILETKAAPGKELSKNPNIATFFVDSNGNVFGNSIIVNKSKTEKIQVKNSASAELVVNVQTGQTVIKYGLIISVIAALITGLMILRKRMK